MYATFATQQQATCNHYRLILQSAIYHNRSPSLCTAQTMAKSSSHMDDKDNDELLKGLLVTSDGEESENEPEAGSKTIKTGKEGLKRAKAAAKPQADSSSSKKHITSAIRENKTLMSLMLKQILANTQADRDAASVLYDIYIAMAASEPVTVGLSQNTAYDKKVRKAGKGHPYGTPNFWTALGVFVGVAQAAVR